MQPRAKHSTMPCSTCPEADGWHVNCFSPPPLFLSLAPPALSACSVKVAATQLISRSGAVTHTSSPAQSESSTRYQQKNRRALSGALPAAQPCAQVAKRLTRSAGPGPARPARRSSPGFPPSSPPPRAARGRRGVERHAGGRAFGACRAVRLGRAVAAAPAMAALEGALEEGEGGSGEAGERLGADGQGCARISAAGGCRKLRSPHPWQGSDEFP